MKYDQIQAFRVIAKEESFSKAAIKLYISQPALSKKIGLLEKDLDCVLFERSRQGVKLTDHGELLLEETSNIEEKLGDIRFRLKHLDENQAGHIKLACSDTVGAFYLPKWLGNFMSDHKDVLLTAKISVTSQIVQSLINEEINFGFFLAPESDPRIESIPLFDYEDVLVYPKEHRFQKSKGISIEEILKEKLLLPGKNTMTRKKIETAFHAKGFTIQDAQEAGSVSVLKEFVRIGLGVGICPNYALSEEELENSFSLGKEFKRTIVIGWRKDRYFTKAERAFIDWVRDLG
jgi:DNA-binding transcriptional LysR family regulator